MKNLIRAATDLGETRLFRRQRTVFSEGKTAHFENLDLYHEAIDKSNYRSFSVRPQRLRNNPIYQSASRCVELKTAPDQLRRPVNCFYQIMKIIYNVFHKNVFSELQKNCSAISQSPR